MAQATRWNDGTTIEHTPETALEEGAVVVTRNGIAVADRPIAANELGTLFFHGVYDLVKVTGAITLWDDVFWDSAGNPVVGTAGTGAANKSGTGVFAGRCVKAAASGDATVRVRILENGEGFS